MKFNKYIGWTLGLIGLLSGCADNDFSDSFRPWDGEVPDELIFTVNVADPELVRVGETRADDGTISNITVMQYDKDGHFIEMLTPAVIKEGGKYKINVKLDKSASSLHIAANHTVSSGCEDLSTEVISTALPTNDAELAAWHPVLWGNIKLSDVLTSANRYEPEIVLYRTVAKVTVANSAENFIFKGYSVYYTADKGTVAPIIANHSASKPTEAPGVSYSAVLENLGPTDVAYLYETPKETTTNTPKVIIEGEIGGNTYYYVAGFRNRTGSGPSDNPGNGKYDYTPLDLLRNHHYAFEITSVRGEGWSSLEAAKNAQPDNRLTVWVSDINEEINSMVSSRDYMLGVQDCVEVDWDKAAEMTVVSSYPSMESDPISISLADATTNWIKVGKDAISIKSETSSTDDVSGKTVKKIVYTIPLDKNDKKTSSREGSVIIRVGDLSREVKIIQNGRSLRRDRGAFIYGLTGVSDGTNYFKWVDEKCLGLLPENNRGLERNNALIFAAVPAYGSDGIYYKIPKKFADEEGMDSQPTLDNTTDFSIESEGGNWVIKAKDNSKPKVASAKLVLHSSNGAEIDYELLQVGFFHELTTSHIADYAKGDNVKAGWHYYEVVKIGGYYLLDRNLGASSNCSYDPVNINYSEEDADAIGGYFVVNPKRAEGSAINTTDATKRYQDLQTVTESLGLKYTAGKFHIPSEAEFKTVGLTTGNHGAGAMKLMVDATSKVAEGCVYIPAAGYYFGSTIKNALHGNVWTRTLLGGSQGLTETDKEYGTQYRFLDFYGGYVNYGNLRTSAGSDGNVNSNLRNFVPIRLVWRGTKDVLDGTDSGASIVNPDLPSTYTYSVWGQIINGGDGWAEALLTEEDGKWVLKSNGQNKVSLKKGQFGIRANENGVQKQWIVGKKGALTVNVNGDTQCYAKELIGDNADNLKLEQDGTYSFSFDPVTMILTLTKEGGSSPSTYRILWPQEGDFWQIGLFNESGDELNGYKTNFKLDNEKMFAYDYTDLPANFKIKFRQGEGGAVRVPKGNKVYTASDFSENDGRMELRISTLEEEGGSTPTPDPVTDTDVIYTPGAANEWKKDQSMKLTTSDNGKTYMGVAYINGDFKFLKDDAWYGKGDADNKIGSGDNLNKPNGYYWISVDWEKREYSMTKIDKISITGASFNSWNGDADLTPNSNHTIWTGTVNFGTGGEWKLRANHGWDLSWGGSEKDLKVSGNNLKTSYSGSHKVTLDLSRQKFKVTVE
ncbi:MAG: hypothetical protein K2H46_03980 [Muribaculaceae bacterium]|nr:hypothetical protein [Muribaculaceae bacterium]